MVRADTGRWVWTLVVAVIVGTGAATITHPTTAAAAADAPSYDELVANVQRAVMRPGYVLRTTTTMIDMDAARPDQHARSVRTLQGIVVSWIDPATGRIRQQVSSPRGTRSGGVVTDGRWYQADSGTGVRTGDGVRCADDTIVAPLVEPCRSAPVDTPADRTTITPGRTEGVDAWVVAERRSFFGEEITTRTWFEQRTGFPFASDQQWRVFDPAQASKLVNEHALQRLAVDERSAFVPADSLPDDFFTVDAVAAWVSGDTSAPAAPAMVPAPTDPSSTDATSTTAPTAPTVLRSGSASDGVPWTLTEAKGWGTCLGLDVGTGDAVVGADVGCVVSASASHLPRSVVRSRGLPPFVVVGAPHGTKSVEIIVRPSNGAREFRIVGSDPIRTSSGPVAFVVELPEIATNVRSTSVVH